jgi:hypothetical protein
MTVTLRSVFAVLALVFGVACSDSGKLVPDGPGPLDAGPPDASCFTDPRTHNEIINSCTTATKVYKSSRPALLNPDGTLPPLP